MNFKYFDPDTLMTYQYNLYRKLAQFLFSPADYDLFDFFLFK